MLMPKRVKFRKQQRGRRCGKATSGDTLAFGSYGLVSLEAVWLNARQIEAARVAISHSMKKGGRMWLRVFPDKPVTKKPAETRMGKGKGAPEYWVCVVKPGRVVLEVDGVTDADAHSLLRLAGSKLPMRTRIVKRPEGFTYEGF